MNTLDKAKVIAGMDVAAVGKSKTSQQILVWKSFIYRSGNSFRNQKYPPWKRGHGPGFRI